MSKEMESLYALMTQLGNGIGFDELAAPLLGHKGMVLIIPATELVRSMEANEQPKISYVLQTDNGQVPYVFTSGAIANECAVENGWVSKGAGTASITKPWIDGLREFLWRGDVGVIIDHGAEH